MKRGGPLKRYTQLTSNKPMPRTRFDRARQAVADAVGAVADFIAPGRATPFERRTAELARGTTGLSRGKPMRRVSPEAAAEQRAWRAIFEIVAEAAGWKCVYPGCWHAPEHGHHIQPRGRGGQDTLENCAPVCHHCHRLIHDYPDTAAALGLLKSGAVEVLPVTTRALGEVA